jgi:hypothetical protein
MLVFNDEAITVEKPKPSTAAALDPKIAASFGVEYTEPSGQCSDHDMEARYDHP